jgi:hypothetical protein
MNNTNTNSEYDKNNTISTNDEFKNTNQNTSQNTNNELKKNLLSVQNVDMNNVKMINTKQRVRYKKLIRREAIWFDK